MIVNIDWEIIMGEIFNANDAVAVAWIIRFTQSFPEEGRLTDIDSPDDAKNWVTFCTNQLAKKESGAEDAPDDRFVVLDQDLKEAMLKLTNEDTFEKIADINDDSGPNDVEVEDLFRGVVKKDIYVKMQEEGTSKGKLPARMATRCPMGFKTMQMALQFDHQNARFNLFQEAYSNCNLENRGKPLNADEKKEIDDIVAYHGIFYMFYGTDYRVRSYDIGNIYGDEGAKCFQARYDALMGEIEKRPTRVPQFLLPYFIEIK